jgi:hypothetical protein
MCIIHDNTCNDNCCSRKNIIIHWVCIQRWFHYSCYRDLWLFSFSFQLLFFVLCLGHYSLLIAIFFNSHDAYSFIIHSVCTLSSSVHMTIQFFNVLLYLGNIIHLFYISHITTHAPPSLAELIDDIFLVYDLIFVNVLVVTFLVYNFQFICV